MACARRRCRRFCRSSRARVKARIGDGLSELEPAPACYDGMDNDGDGRTDEQDPGCTAGGTLKPEDDHE